MTCLGIGHNQFRDYRKRLIQYVFCAKAYKSKNYKYRVNKCITKKGKICIYIISKCENYRGNH